MTRDEAWVILSEHTKNPNLLKHMVAVEAVMRAYARRFGFDLRAICRDLQEQERTSGRVVVSFPPRRPEPRGMRGRR